MSSPGTLADVQSAEKTSINALLLVVTMVCFIMFTMVSMFLVCYSYTKVQVNQHKFSRLRKRYDKLTKEWARLHPSSPDISKPQET